MRSVSITDIQFRVAVAGAGLALVAGIAVLRFAGAVALPSKPPPPPPVRGTSSQLLSKSVASPVFYLDFVARDAAAAGVDAPTLDQMARKLPYHIDEGDHVLEVGQPALELAGVRLRAVQIGDALALAVDNASDADLAYRVTSTPVSLNRSSSTVRCSGAPVQAFNAMTIARGGSEARTECVWHAGIAVEVSRIETIELSPLSAWYVNHVAPSVVGIPPRISRGHVVPGLNAASDRCTPVPSAVVRSGLERGEIGWRDLVDFYARHRCQTYQFPLSYRAFNADGERPVPAVSAGM